MNLDRWTRIEEIFHRAAEGGGAQRCGVLDQWCEGDADLRREVEALLAFDESATACLESAVQSELQSLAYPLIGESISHFVILDCLDAGGMGVVYRARDIRLARIVAIKFLPEDSALDPQARGRFEREAQAVSALEHPNICPIYEFGEHNGQLFLVMPLLDGRNLRELIADVLAAKKTLHLEPILDLATQTLGGLDAAHRHGLIHRDIKPGNLFVTGLGQLKILDFGLAKFSEAFTDYDSPGTPTSAPLVPPLDNSLSCTGRAIGTAAYMSPEQACGQALDARTDIYSFGIVLFEMATGRRLLADDASFPSEKEIRHRLSQAPMLCNADARSIFAEILCRALVPERERRYHTAGEMCRDLENLRSRFAARRPLHTRIGILITLVIVAGAMAVYFAASGPRRTAAAVAEFRLRQLTSNSVENHILNGAVSPDGKYLAYTDVKGLHLKRLDDGETHAVVLAGNTLDTFNNSPAWFPDSLSFLVNTHDSSTAFLNRTPSDATIWRIFVSGAAPQRIRDNAFAWGVSPVGSEIAFAARHGRLGPREVWLMGPDGRNAHLLYATDEDHQIGPFSWSPDGQRMGFVRGGADGDIGFSIDMRGGPPIPNASDEEMNDRPGSLLLPHNRAIYSLYERGVQDTCNFWIVDVDPKNLEPVGGMHRLTNWTGFCMDPTSTTSDGRKIAFLKWTSSRTVYLADLNAARDRVSTSRHFTLEEAASSPVGWLADGKTLVLWSARDGEPALFRQDIHDDKAQKIASVPRGTQDPVLTGDGKWVLAWEGRADDDASSGKRDHKLMRIPVEGGKPEWIGTMNAGAQISCVQASPTPCIVAEPTQDRVHMVLSLFDPIRGKGAEITRINLNADGVWNADISADGTRVAFVCGASAPIGIFSLRDNSLSWVLTPSLFLKQSLRWDREGRRLYVTNGVKGGSELFSVEMSGAIRKLWHNDGTFAPMALQSADGQHLAIQDSKLDVNMWMLEMPGR